jgi:hypothetical protein
MANGKVRRKKAMQHQLIDVMEINVLRSQPPSEVGRALQVVLDSNTRASSIRHMLRQLVQGHRSVRDCARRLQKQLA